ncbi:hypothetical protein F6R98_14475 [Candidatus Methylospira mobilis]|uniref:Uncharacterized protein n=1 Tax=Candidatus Methylospira mobilis TaxID=1808979 RepID=A0A5Q0BKL7_9GAMM|nr:hypothetical protein [Candidatus Methylospira mobilis]QFY43682.1 hypothetical protein F6R98_14475 [Candidatus Methylospira mobilis]WNV04669.1 hypothetical protein RP726_20110 [Candidatus Methylospira mobilis]
MSDDLAFKIQLGVILPKMKEKLTTELSSIVEDVVKIVQAGNRAGEVFEMEPVKQIILKDFDIFLTDCILPEIERKLAPAPVEEASAAEAPPVAEASEAP